jgi:hypothetical protein
MKKNLLLGLACLAPATLFAQSAFEGTWRMNLQSTQYVGKDNFLLRDSMFRCSTCSPKLAVKADGRDHPVTGSPYFDAVNVKVVDERALEIMYKKAGKVSSTTKLTAAQDGKTLRSEFDEVTEGGQKISGKYTSTREGAAPQGTHKISGLWQPGKLESASESIIEVTYKATDDGLSMSGQAGSSYTAKFDGKDYPYAGDPGITSVSLRKIDANTIEETDKRNGKAIWVTRMTVAPDGKTMSVKAQDKVRGVTIGWTAEKQR